MRHRVYGNKLGRDKDQRTALFKGLIHHLFTYGTIETSETKAKAVKGLVDKVITLAKSKTSQHKVQSVVTDKAVKERLINAILPKMQNRTSGYTSLVKMGTRPGDQTMMVKMSLIGAEELKPIEKESRIKSLESRKQDTKPIKTKNEQVNKIVKKKEATKVTKERSKKY